MTASVDALPYPFTFEPATTALIVIDMQRDFLEPGGFGETLGNDVSHLWRAVEPTAALLAACREVGLAMLPATRSASGGSPTAPRRWRGSASRCALLTARC